MLEVASKITGMEKAQLDILNNEVVNKLTLESKLPLAELGRIAYFRPDTLPVDYQSELTVTRHYTPRQYGFTFTNGIQASWVEVDVDTGFVKLLKHWCVEDSGTVINPMLVDEQLRGGIVQGIGAALYEECLYSPDGQLLNGNMADYIVPMSGEMPDIVCAHVETPTRQSQLGAKGVGEAGTAGAPGAVMNAVNDALAPLGARVTAMPFTPERILKALGKV
jgi:carbon-monoxide dehydrogenase large subunit